MAFRYNIKPNSPDSHQSNPWWFAVIVRFKHIHTFDRNTIVGDGFFNQINVSRKDADADPVAEREPLVITNQITAFTVAHSKASHTCSASFTVVPGKFRFESETQAGDWVLFWAFDNLEDYQRVLANALATLRQRGNNFNGIRANGFNDGLKFVGRLNAPKRRRAVDPGTGMPHKVYSLTAVGFDEFDAKVEYDQAHVAKYSELVNGFVGQVADYASNIDQKVADGVPIKTGDHVQLWLETFLGAGPGAASKGFEPSLIEGAAFATDVTQTGALLQSPNDCFLVPRSVGRLLGVDGDGKFRYFDLLSIFIGVQGPTYQLDVDRNEKSPLQYTGFVPSTVGELSGSFRPQYTQFSGTSVWELVRQYSNEPLNEMFVTLRVNAQGRVCPTFMLRQTPFSSQKACQTLRNRGWGMTAYVDLPRWVVSNALVSDENLGPSDSLRYNYVKVQGNDPVGETQVMLLTYNSNVAPPMADMASIKRTGVRPFIAPINSDISGAIDPRGQLGRGYTQFMADIVMDQHMKWNGTLSTKGIQEPVSVGDNLEYDDVIYHIEGVTHSGHIESGTGRKVFDTTFQLSSGVSVASEQHSDNVMPYMNPPHDERTDYEVRQSLDLEVFEAGAILDQTPEDDVIENAVDFIARGRTDGTRST